MNFPPGTVVFRIARNAPKLHFGIVTERRTVIENQLGIGVREVPEVHFEGDDVVLPFTIPGAKYFGQQVVDRARELKGSPYSFSFHCEHFVNFVVTDEAKSLQSDLIALLVAALFDASPERVKKFFAPRPPQFPSKKAKPDPVTFDAERVQRLIAAYIESQKRQRAEAQRRANEFKARFEADQRRRQKEAAEKMEHWLRLAAESKARREAAEAKAREDFKQLLAKLNGKKPE